MKRVAGYYPPPVYGAVFAEGDTLRVSFHSPKGKPIDVAYGRRVAAMIGGRPNVAPDMRKSGRGEGHQYDFAAASMFFNTYSPRTVATGHVEWDGEIIPDDMSVKPNRAAPKPNAARAMRDAMAALEKGDAANALAILRAAA